MAEQLAAALTMTLTAPVLLVAALGVMVLSKRSPFVAHQRVGQGGRPIWVLKLRTMWKDENGGLFPLVQQLSVSGVTNDVSFGSHGCKGAGVTSRFAALCRRYSIDELPQFWQVAKGEMALVGPRPLTRLELDLFYGAAAEELTIAKPGLSGLWQICGRSRLSYAQRRRLDLFMLRNWSVPLYLRILFLTFPRVLAGKDAW